MSETEMNSYRLTSMDEPGDERMNQIMLEVAEEAQENSRIVAERVAAGIDIAVKNAHIKVNETLNKLRNVSK